MEGQVWIQFVDNIPFVGSTREAVETATTRWKQHKDSNARDIRGPKQISGEDVGAALEDSVKLIPDGVRAEVELFKSGSEFRSGAADTVDAGAEAPKRGDHVINNNLLKLFKNIIDAFLKSAQFGHKATTWEEIVREGLSKNTLVHQAYYQPMSPDDTQFIMYTAVVHSGAAIYVNGNEDAYGKAVKELSKVCDQYMYHVYLSRHGKPGQAPIISNLERNLKELVEKFIKSDVYIDEAAKAVWLKANPTELKHYQEVKRRVGDMLRRLIYTGTHGEVIQWVADIEKYLNYVG